MDKVKIVAFVFILVSLYSCKAKYLSVSPIPTEQMEVTYEMKYIENTDQTDRKKGFIHIVFNSKKGKLIIERDSIRANRVYELYIAGQIQTDDGKFTAGLIFMHSPIDGHGKLAYEVFSDLEKNGATMGAKKNGEYWKNLVVKQGIYKPENEN